MSVPSQARLIRHPALALAAAFAAGIAAHQRGLSMGATAVILIASLVLLAAGRLHQRQRLASLQPLARTAAALLAVACAGAVWSLSASTLPGHHVARLVPSDGLPHSVLEGRVIDEPRRGARATRFVVEARRVLLGVDTLSVAGRVEVTLYAGTADTAAALPAATPGDLVRFTGRLRLPGRPRNPAAFDYGAYLARRGIHARLTVEGTANLAYLGREATPLGAIITALRTYVGRQVDRYVDAAPARAVLRALLLGDRHEIDQATRDRFARTGLLHVLAVSGLHVLLVGMVLYQLLRPLLIRLGCRWSTMEQVRAAATLLLLLGYLLATGASASVVRAVVMAGLYIGGVLLQRPAHALNTMGAAALVLLVAAPGALFDVGFQLSFAAVAALIVLQPVLARAVPLRWRKAPVAGWVLTLMLTSLAATLGTLPVLLYHFGQASFAGLVLNLAAIPLTLFTLAAGLVVVLLGGIFPFAAAVFGSAGAALAEGLRWTATGGDRLFGWAVWHQYLDGTWNVLALCALLGLVACWQRPRRRGWVAVSALACLNLGLWPNAFTQAYAPTLDVIFFDVGQGDAALLKLPGGRHLLIDAGPRDSFVDEGERTLVPHLARYGIDRLDAVLITHPHSDHLGGLPALLRAVPVGQVLHNGQGYGSALYRETQRLLDSLAIPHTALQAGDTLGLDPDVRLQVLAPVPAAGASANDASVILRVAYGTTSLLFTGDAEADAEATLQRAFAPLLPSNVVKVAHHGSRTSSTPGFVAAAATNAPPPLAVVSVAARNRHGLPDEEVLARWQAHGAPLITTADAGAVWLRSDGKQVRRVLWHR